ncbi:MAG: endoribonuclease MazF [Mesorhizobium sp.]
MAAWMPDSGEIVWVNFDPQAGHEQAGHRPALVLSPARYNGMRGMMLCCPLTTKLKGYPFEVVISQSPPSAILADQIKNLDWRARKAKRKGDVTAAVLADVRAKLKALFQI